MYRMALIAGDIPGLNRERCIKIAIVHDIKFFDAEEIKELWAEYENNSSLEANLVKDFDKESLEYEMEHGKVLDEFFISTAGKFQTGLGKSWAAEIISRRKHCRTKAKTEFLITDLHIAVKPLSSLKMPCCACSWCSMETNRICSWQPSHKG